VALISPGRIHTILGYGRIKFRFSGVVLSYREEKEERKKTGHGTVL